MSKKLFKKVGYLRAIIVMLPLSIFLIVAGFKGINTKLNELDMKVGIIENIKYSNNTAYIKLKSEKFYYETSITQKVYIIKNQINIGDKITLYKSKGRSNLIKRIDKNNIILFDYKSFNFGALIIFIIGIVTLLITLLYVLKSSHHLIG